MWPYRPAKLTDLLSREELSALLSQGIGNRLRSNVLLVEPGGDSSDPEVLVSIDGEHESPFCSLLRHGKENGQASFAGGDAACRRCEKRFAARALRELQPQGPGENPCKTEVLQARCHMGLQDLAAAVKVGDQLLAVLVAGRRIAAEEDRTRIQKKVGKLGKLTQAEKRSMEKAGNEAVAPVTPASEGARQRLIEEIASIEKIEPSLEAELSRAADMLSSFSQGRLQAARQAWETSVLEALVPGTKGLPVRRSAILNWLDSATGMARRALDLEFVAVFGRLPESTGKSAAALRLLSQAGLEGDEDEEVSLRGEDAALLLDPAPFRIDCKTVQESINGGLEAPSALIGAIKSSSTSPAGWKDRLTKSLFVTAPATNDGLELVFVFGPPRGPQTPAPADEDYLLLWKAARALCDRYLLVSLVLIPLQWLAVKLGLKMQRKLPQLWHRIATRLVGIKIEQIGAPAVDRPLLIASNHASWVDITVVGSLMPLSFIAKSEVSGWPIFGLFAKLQRTVFVNRTRRTETAQVADAIADRMAAGDAMVLFAEGTSNDGNCAANSMADNEIRVRPKHFAGLA